MTGQLTFDKSKILERIRANREIHRGKVETAWKNYREEIIAELDKRLAQAKDGKKIDPGCMSRFPIPMDYTKEYDKVIDRLETSKDTEIELDEHEFDMWMRDEWGWQNAFVANSSRYGAS